MLNNNVLRQLDLQDVMVFLCLYEHKSARRTAEVLSISQPTVSYCLKRLRNCFHDVLFDVDHGSLVATSKAEAIEPYLRNVIDAVNHCADMDDDQVAAAAHRVIRVCAPEYFELLLLPGVLESFMKRGRETSLIVERLGRELPVERLLAGEIDFATGFGPGYHRLHPDLQWESVLSDTFVCLTASRKLAPTTRVTLDEFCDMHHVFPTPWISERNMIDGWLEKLGRSRNIVARANTYQACLNIVSRLPVVLTLPQRLIPYLSIPPSVQICDVPLGFPTFTLDVIWATQMEKNHDIRSMRMLFKDLASANALEPGAAHAL
ncbi:LysR family transcriptional regulator [Burkholderia ubonensis]|uniref:LysR family transcriptional regulator n=1 Tax=Burkholderia ubonensis subsp. mesacidophila TaxID=265293 RepID=A0A2A4FB28_9BURK|nr:LysR family transcriptional regulator [Burkholderia ubonensis]PCE29784.1 LysR family transcriptional regulator [Burkholderia ubonensis subsp. mesacidophila]